MSVFPFSVSSFSSYFQFLQSYHKISLIKVAWYVLGVKNMNSYSPLDPLIFYDVRRNRAKPLNYQKRRSQTMYTKTHFSPKQLCASANLGCTHEAGTFQYLTFSALTSVRPSGVRDCICACAQVLVRHKLALIPLYLNFTNKSNKSCFSCVYVQILCGCSKLVTPFLPSIY